MHIECNVNVAYVLKKKTKEIVTIPSPLAIQVEQLGQNGYNVAVMVHKPNPERDTIDNSSTPYIDGPTVVLVLGGGAVAARTSRSTEEAGSGADQ